MCCVLAGGSGGNTGTLLAIVLPIIGVLVILGVVLFIKNRRLTKELEIEVRILGCACVRVRVRLALCFVAYPASCCFSACLNSSSLPVAFALSLQMHDVPKSAIRKAVRGPQGGEPVDEKAASKASKKYSKLLTDDDDDPDYAPPDFDNQPTV